MYLDLIARQLSLATYIVQILLLASSSNSLLYVVELTVGYESNLYKNVRRKQEKYKDLIKQLRNDFKDDKFVNISMSSLGVFANESVTFMKMLDNVGFSETHKMYCVRKMTSIAIRTSYYIFCCRDKDWENPVLFTL